MHQTYFQTCRFSKSLSKEEGLEVELEDSCISRVDAAGWSTGTSSTIRSTESRCCWVFGGGRSHLRFLNGLHGATHKNNA